MMDVEKAGPRNDARWMQRQFTGGAESADGAINDTGANLSNNSDKENLALSDDVFISKEVEQINSEISKTNTLQSQPSNASSYGYATSIPMQQQTYSQHLSQPPKRQSHF